MALLLPWALRVQTEPLFVTEDGAKEGVMLVVVAPKTQTHLPSGRRPWIPSGWGRISLETSTVMSDRAQEPHVQAGVWSSGPGL